MAGLTRTGASAPEPTGIAPAAGTIASATSPATRMRTVRLIDAQSNPVSGTTSRPRAPVLERRRVAAPHPESATFTDPGRLAQLGERRLDKAEVAGSSPASSIRYLQGIRPLRYRGLQGASSVRPADFRYLAPARSGGQSRLGPQAGQNEWVALVGESLRRGLFEIEQAEQQSEDRSGWSGKSRVRAVGGT